MALAALRGLRHPARVRGAASATARAAPRGARISASAFSALACVAAMAFALRLAGGDWGEPYAYHFDEPFVVKPALRMVATGDPNPHFFRYPSLLLYLEAAVVAGNHVLGGMPLDEPQGPAYGPSDLLPQTWPALAGGRHLVAFFGALGVLAAGWLAAATGGPVAGVVAAALLAVFPLHVEHSHYLTTDVPMSTFLVLAFAALASVRRTTLAAALAGAAAGLAVATKYTAAAGVPALALACLLGGGRPGERARRTGVLLAACAAGFAAATPFALLDFGSFAAELRVVRDHYRGGHLGAEGAWNWAWYLERLRTDGLGDAGLALIALGTAGVVFDLARGRRRRTDLALAREAAAGRDVAGARLALVFLGLAAAWTAYLGTVPVRFERNLMPAVVLACAAAGHGLASFADAARERGRPLQLLILLAIAGALLAPARRSLEVVRRLTGPDTRSQAAEWIDRNVAPGTKIVREEYTPQPDPERYRVEYVWSLAFRDLAEYERQGVDVVVASRGVYGRFLAEPGRAQHPEMARRYDRLLSLPPVASFAPGARVSGPWVQVYRLDGARDDRPR